MSNASPALRVAVVPVTNFQQNCSVIRCEETGRGAVVDPGGDVDLICEAIEELDIVLEKVLITHAHIDHAGGTAALLKRFQVPIEGPHPEDQFLIDTLEEQSKLFGFPQVETFSPTRFLRGGDSVSVGNLTFAVRHCPGHTPGHVVFVHEGERIAFVGDVLFAGSIGRTDFPRGDHATLLRSIREQLFPMGDDITFIPGHGQPSTFGQERTSNPFVQ